LLIDVSYIVAAYGLLYAEELDSRAETLEANASKAQESTKHTGAKSMIDALQC